MFLRLDPQTFCHTDSVRTRTHRRAPHNASHPPDSPRHGADDVSPHWQGRHRARRLGWRRSAATEARLVAAQCLDALDLQAAARSTAISPVPRSTNLVVTLPDNRWSQATCRARRPKKVGRKVCAQLVLSIPLISDGLRLSSIGRRLKVAARHARGGPYSLIFFGTGGCRSPLFLFAHNAHSYGGESSFAQAAG